MGIQECEEIGGEEGSLLWMFVCGKGGEGYKIVISEVEFLE